MTKASDVLDLGRARALLGCSPEMSLVDGILALLAKMQKLEVDRASAQDDGD